MPFTIDHIIVGVKSLEAAAADFRAHGFTVSTGGRHLSGLSENALVFFADGTCIELLSYLRPAPEAAWWKILDTDGEGYLTYHLFPSDTDALYAEVSARGLVLPKPVSGGRNREDGKRIEWKVVWPDAPDVPMWLGDTTPRELRVPPVPRDHHANGATGIGMIRVAVSDIDNSADRYGKILGTEGVVAGDSVREFAVGDCRIQLVGAEADEAAKSHLQRRGQGPFSMTLTGNGDATPQQLKVQGADIQLVN